MKTGTRGEITKVLLISKDQNFAEEINHILNASREEAIEFNSAYPVSKAISVLRDQHYDLVLVDLPEAEACAHAFAQLCTLPEKPPVIVLTNSGFRRSADLLKKGAQFVVNKAGLEGELFCQKVQTAIDRQRIEHELRLKDEILQVVNFAAEVFLADAKWEAWIGEVLARLGQATLSDRVYIFRNQNSGETDLRPRLYADWAVDGVLPKSNFGEYIFSKYNQSGFQRWARILGSGKEIFGFIEDLPSGEQPPLMKMGIQSFAAIPIFFDHTWWGFIGFDQCRQKKSWLRVEIDALQTAARIIGAAIARQAAEEKLVHLATHDYLTGLPNRMLFVDRFIQAQARAERSGEKIAIVSIDLDKFKAVNDTYGHPAGDAVLTEAANRLSTALRTSDTTARIGGDEFGVIAENIHNRGDVMRVLEKLDAVLKPAITVQDKIVALSASMGAALFPDNGRTLEELLNAADKALYQAKERRGTFKIYKDEQIPLIE